MLGVRRPSLVRQMAFRQDSNESDLVVRHGHLAAPLSIPDSPRPVKDEKSSSNNNESTVPASPLTLTMPVPPAKHNKDAPVRLESIVLEEKK